MHPDEDYAYETQRQRQLDEEFEMDIDYAAIIEKANTRKDVLVQLTEHLKEAPAKYDEVQEAIQWVAELIELFAPLDTEGRALLPTPVRCSLEYAASMRTFLESAVFRQWNGIDTGLKELAAHV